MASHTEPFPFLQSGGEMGARTRDFDWSQTPVGAPQQWSQSLRTTVGIVLTSRFPMLLWWGPELIQFYNDAYRISLGKDGGKHPIALGQPGAKSWVEVWPTIKPLIDQVLEGKGATWSGNQLIPIYRNDQLEDAYWTFSYSPVQNNDGQVAGVLVICQETTQQVVAQRELAISEQRFRSLIAQAPVAIALFSGPQFIITLANERVLKYWDRSQDQVMNKPLFEALPEASRQGFEELLTHVYTTGKRFVANELTVTLHRNGRLEPTYIDFVYEPFYDNHHTISGVIVVCTEITEQVQQQQIITATNQELEVVNRTLEMTNGDLKRSNDNLQQFAYVASHDLQEPLRKIQSFGNLLQQNYKTSLDEAGLDIINRMSSAALRMSILIRDLLSYSRIATRQQYFLPVSLNAILASALDTLSLEITQRNVQISIEELPPVRGDESQLSQLFQNLLSNAIKFTPVDQQPQIRVACSQVPLSDLPAEVRLASDASFFHRISVSDQGIGFDTKYLDRIFQVFQRLHGKNEFPGSGIGLAICQRVVENHGGGITASSQLGKGTTFWVYLPA